MDAFSASLTELPTVRAYVHSKAKMNIDTERLITEVRLSPPIWDLSSAFYKDRDAKISAWRQVCKELIPDFDDKSDSEKKDIGK